MKYVQERVLSGSLCGEDVGLSMIGALSIVEDAFSELFGVLGIDGVTTLRKYGAMLVITKNRLILPGGARWNEKLHEECFFSGRTRVKFYTDTCVRGPAGNVVLYSRLEGCAVGLEDGRVRKLDSVGIDASIREEQPMLDLEFTKQAKAGTLVESTEVRPTNLDYLHHTNNVEYMRFLLNTLPREDLLLYRDAEIKYERASYIGERLDIYRDFEEDCARFAIRRGGEDILFCTLRKNSPALREARETLR